MTSPRPLMQNGIAQLESMFANASTDQKVLKQLESELKHRQVPRAVNLLGQVQAALRSASKPSSPLENSSAGRDSSPTVAPPPPVAPAKQPELWPLPGSAKAASKNVESVAVKPAAEVVAPPARVVVVQPGPVISPEAAFQLLNASPGTPWETVEKVRRKLVDAAHPARLRGLSLDKQAQAQDIARRANAAYAVLHALRASS